MEFEVNTLKKGFSIERKFDKTEKIIFRKFDKTEKIIFQAMHKVLLEINKEMPNVKFKIVITEIK